MKKCSSTNPILSKGKNIRKYAWLMRNFKALTETKLIFKKRNIHKSRLTNNTNHKLFYFKPTIFETPIQ